MPSTSGKEHRLMAAVATNPAVAEKRGIPQSVGRDFMKADKGRTFDHHAHHAAMKKDAKSAPAVRTKSRGDRSGGY